MKIDEFKRQNPAYKDVPDKELADALYKKHYASTGITRADYYNKIGLNGEEVRPPSARSALKSVPAEFNRGIGQGLDAIARVPAIIADTPVNMVVDPVNAALRGLGVDYQLPRSDTYGAVEQLMEPIEQSTPGRAVTGALESLGERWAPEQPEPRNAGERIAQYTARLVGSSVPFAAAPYAGAGRAVTAANAKTVGGRIIQDMQRRAATAPVSTATLEGVAATGAGVGGGIAQEAAPGNYLAEMLGQLIGGIAPGAAPTVLGGKLVASGIRKGRDFASGPAQTRRAEQKVRDTVGDIKAVEPKLREAEAIERRVNEQAARAGSDARMNLSLAERTQSPAIAAAQRDVEGRYSGPELDEAIARRQANQDAISAFAREIEPRAVADADAVAAAAARRGQNVRVALDEQVTRNQMERFALAGKVPTVDLAEKGRALRDELNAQRLAVRDRFDERATAEGLDNADVTLNFDDFKAAVAGKYAPRPSDNRLYRPQVLDDIAASPEGPVTFRDAKGWRERITTDLRVAQRSSNPVDRERARALSGVLRDFDDMIVNAELVNAAPDVAAKWKAFRRDYKDQYVDVFRPPQVKGIRERDIDGFEQMADEAVASEVFKPGNVTMARKFKTAVQAADDDGAFARSMEAVESVALDSLNKAAVRNGQIDQRLLETWKRQHQSVLDEFPYLKGQVDDIQQANAALLARNAQLEGRKKAVQRSVMERKLAAVESGAKTPEGLIDDAVKNHAVASRLVTRLRGDKDALNGLRQAVWDKMPLDDPDATIKFLADNNRSLAAIFTPEHLSDIRMIAQARKMASTVNPPSGKPVDTSPFSGIEKAIGSSLPSLSARARAIRQGRSGVFYEGPATAMQWWRARANASADKVWQQALYDPDVARAILVAQNNPSSIPGQERLRRTLWNIGLSLEPDMPNARLPGGFIQAGEEED